MLSSKLQPPVHPETLSTTYSGITNATSFDSVGSKGSVEHVEPDEREPHERATWTPVPHRVTAELPQPETDTETEKSSSRRAAFFAGEKVKVEDAKVKLDGERSGSRGRGRKESNRRRSLSDPARDVGGSGKMRGTGSKNDTKDIQSLLQLQSINKGQA